MKTPLKMFALAMAVNLAILGMGVAEASAAPKAQLSLGDFAVILATAGHADLRDLDARSAAGWLAEAGVPIGDLEATLDERKLAEILDHYGIRATTRRPDASVDPGKAAAAALLIGETASFGAAFGGSSSTTLEGEVEQCLEERNHGQCVVCCKAYGLPAKACSRMCMAINQASPSEPLP